MATHRNLIIFITLLTIINVALSSKISVKSLKNCNENSPIKINIVRNQNENGSDTISGDLIIPEDINDNFLVNLTVSLRHIGLEEINESWCKLMKTYTKSFLGIISKYINVDLDLCKIYKGNYHFKDIVLNLEELLAKTWVPPGEYDVSMKIVDKSSGNVSVCYQVNVEVTS